MNPLHKDEGPTVAAVAPQESRNDAVIIAQRDAADKRIATLQAQFALAGFQLHVVAGPAGQAEYIASRWALHKVLPDLAAAEMFISQVGGAA